MKKHDALSEVTSEIITSISKGRENPLTYFDVLYEKVKVLDSVIGSSEIYEEGKGYQPCLLLDDSSPTYLEDVAVIKKLNPNVSHHCFTGKIKERMMQAFAAVTERVTTAVFGMPRSGEEIAGEIIQNPQGGEMIRTGTLAFYSRIGQAVSGISCAHLFYNDPMGSDISIKSWANLPSIGTTTHWNLSPFQPHYFDALAFRIRNQALELVDPIPFVQETTWRTDPPPFAWAKGKTTGHPQTHLGHPFPIKMGNASSPVLGFFVQSTSNPFGKNGDSGSALIFSSNQTYPFNRVDANAHRIAGVFMGTEEITGRLPKQVFTAVWRIADSFGLEGLGSLKVA